MGYDLKYQCSKCGCFFATIQDYRSHVCKPTDEPKFWDPLKVATGRKGVPFVWEYKYVGNGRCELCGREGLVVRIATDGYILTRCEPCFLDLAGKAKKVAFVVVEPSRNLAKEGDGALSLFFEEG